MSGFTEFFVAPSDQASLDQIDAARAEVVAGATAGYDYRSVPERVEDALYSKRRYTQVAPKPPTRKEATRKVSRFWRGASITLVSLNAMVAVDAIEDIRDIDDRIVASIEDSGLPDIDDELEGKSAAEAAAYLAQQEQMNKLDTAGRSLKNDMSSIAAEAQDAGERFGDSMLGVTVFSAIRAVSQTSQWARRRRERGSRYVLKHGGARPKDDPVQLGEKLTQPAPRTHITTAGADDESAVLKLTTKLDTSHMDRFDKAAYWYQRKFSRLLVGGLILFNPLTMRAAEHADTIIDAIAPSEVQDTTTWVGRKLAEGEQARVEDSVEESTEEMLPNITEIAGGDLDPVFAIAGEQAQAELDEAMDAAGARPVTYRPISTNARVLNNLYGGMFGSPYDQGPNTVDVYLATLVVSTLGAGLLRMTDFRPLFSRRDGVVYMSERALEQSINTETDERTAEGPDSAVKRRRDRRAREKEAARQFREELGLSLEHRFGGLTSHIVESDTTGTAADADAATVYERARQRLEADLHGNDEAEE